jgi:hypothetical protein
MKKIILLSLLMITSLVSFSKDIQTQSRQEIIIDYFEKEYGEVKSIEVSEEKLILTFENNLIYLDGDELSGIYNFKTNSWEDIQLNKKNIDHVLREYSFWELCSDESGLYISIKKYDDSFEYRLYFEEYYLEKDFIVYYNNNEKLKISNKKAYLDNIEFKFLN